MYFEESLPVMLKVKAEGNVFCPLKIAETVLWRIPPPTKRFASMAD